MKISQYIFSGCMGLCVIFNNACSSNNVQPSLKKEILEHCWGNASGSVIVDEYPINSEANVLVPSMVRAYGVGRYADPLNSNVMHERHVIYRLEQEPRWRYNVDSDKQILIGNTISDSRCAYQPALLDKEIAVELQKQRVINKNLQLTYKKMLELYEKVEETQIQFLKNLNKFNQNPEGESLNNTILESEAHSDVNQIIVNTQNL